MHVAVWVSDELNSGTHVVAVVLWFGEAEHGIPGDFRESRLVGLMDGGGV